MSSNRVNSTRTQGTGSTQNQNTSSSNASFSQDQNPPMGRFSRSSSVSSTTSSLSDRGPISEGSGNQRTQLYPDLQSLYPEHYEEQKNTYGPVLKEIYGEDWNGLDATLSDVCDCEKMLDDIESVSRQGSIASTKSSEAEEGDKIWKEAKEMGIPRTIRDMAHFRNRLLSIARKIDADLRGEDIQVAMKKNLKLKDKIRKLGQDILDRIKPVKGQMNIFSSIGKKILYAVWKLKMSIQESNSRIAKGIQESNSRIAKGIQESNLRIAKKMANVVHEPVVKLFKKIGKKDEIEKFRNKIQDLDRKLGDILDGVDK